MIIRYPRAGCCNACSAADNQALRELRQPKVGRMARLKGTLEKIIPDEKELTAPRPKPVR
jgi:hypothetical protein